jgi:predicted DNA-binding protein with PD1-like motif
MTTNQPAIVDTQTCHQLKDTDKPFILALKMGENLFEGIMRCANAVNLKSASISGLGALDDVTVAYYNLATKQYQTKLFKGMYELISINGNITFLDGKRFIHIHAALGTDTYDVVGGHIMDAIVGPSAEITIIPLDGQINRAYDEATGLKLMCPIV